MNFFIDQVLAVITEVKHKLLFKAIDKYTLLSRHMRSDTDGAPACPDVPAGPSPDDNDQLELTSDKPLPLLLDEEAFIKEYAECPMAFDQMIITITQYFDLVNLNSYKLEDLWLNFMDILGL